MSEWHGRPLEWYLKRQIALTAYAAATWDVWVCGRCGRAVPGNRIVLCLCATKGFREKPAMQ